MSSTFNPQILVEKLVKLNNSQQSIETLSHWCIFHMHKAKQVVETWARQYHSSPRDQRLAFLYLANDILQNSRRKGVEFVAEFWKVLPDALRDVIANGDEFGKNAALRLINIWEERKVFGSRGQILKEEFVKRPLDNGNKMKPAGFKLKPLGGNALDKLVSGYEAVCGSQLDEDAIFNKCRSSVSFVRNVDKDIEGGHVNGSIADELKGHRAILRDCIEQLSVVQSSRANLVTLLREALQEQEYKLDQVRNQLQDAQTHSEQIDGYYKHILGGNSDGRVLTEQNQNVTPPSHTPQSFTPIAREPSTSVIYTPKIPFPQNSIHVEEDPKSAAAAVAAKLTASTSSAEMLTYVLSSLASGGVIGNTSKESSSDYPSEKKPKLENVNSGESNPNGPAPPLSPPPPIPSSPPPMQPLMQPYPIPQYMPMSMPMPSGPYGYNPNQPPMPGMGPSYRPFVPPTNGVPTFSPASNFSNGYPTEGGFYNQASSLPMTPMGHQ